MNDHNSNKSLEEIQNAFAGTRDNCSNRAIANAKPLSSQIKVEKVSLDSNSEYSPKDNLADSKSFSGLFLQ